MGYRSLGKYYNLAANATQTMTTFTDDDIRAVYYNPPYVPLNKRPVFIEQYAIPAIPCTL